MLWKNSSVIEGVLLFILFKLLYFNIKILFIYLKLLYVFISIKSELYYILALPLTNKNLDWQADNHCTFYKDF